MEQLELRTHTRMWQVEKKLYKIYDFTLPMPISLRLAGIAVMTFIPWAILMNALGVPFGPPFGHILWLFPPGILTWAMNKPLVEGRKLHEVGTAQVRFYATQAPAYADLVPDKAPDRQFVTSRVRRGSSDATGDDLAAVTDLASRRATALAAIERHEADTPPFTPQPVTGAVSSGSSALA